MLQAVKNIANPVKSSGRYSLTKIFNYALILFGLIQANQMQLFGQLPDWVDGWVTVFIGFVGMILRDITDEPMR